MATNWLNRWGSRTVDFVLTDGDGGTSNIVQAVINVTGTGAPGGAPVDTPINDPVDGQDDTPEPVPPAERADQPGRRTGKKQGVPAMIRDLDATISPVSDPEALQNAEMTGAGGGSADFLPALGDWAG